MLDLLLLPFAWCGMAVSIALAVIFRVMRAVGSALWPVSMTLSGLFRAALAIGRAFWSGMWRFADDACQGTIDHPACLKVFETMMIPVAGFVGLILMLGIVLVVGVIMDACCCEPTQRRRRRVDASDDKEETTVPLPSKRRSRKNM